MSRNPNLNGIPLLALDIDAIHTTDFVAILTWMEYLSDITIIENVLRVKVAILTWLEYLSDIIKFVSSHFFASSQS